MAAACIASEVTGTNVITINTTGINRVGARMITECELASYLSKPPLALPLTQTEALLRCITGLFSYKPNQQTNFVNRCFISGRSNP